MTHSIHILITQTKPPNLMYVLKNLASKIGVKPNQYNTTAYITILCFRFPFMLSCCLSYLVNTTNRYIIWSCFVNAHQPRNVHDAVLL